MKIGVITFHRAVNYGALLQTYALQRVLNKMNIQNEVIDYRCKAIEDRYWRVLKKQSFLSMVKTCILYKRDSKKRKKFLEFINCNIKLSKNQYLSHEDLISTNNEYDYFITGSDQVWNYNMVGFDEAYFLNFVENGHKKCSYAASLGIQTLPEEYHLKYKKLLENFDQISVRENRGKDILSNFINKDIEVVLDPTLLLDKQEWKDIATVPYDKDYILIYIIKWSDSLFEFAYKLSIKTGYKIKYITNGIKKPIRNAEYITTAGIEEFVGLFLNARYIVTNSFHGTVFSLIMNKDFFLELQNPPAPNDRLENIMDTYKLRCRQIIDGKNDKIYEKIDYNYINQKLEINKNQSLEFLRNIIKNNSQCINNI